MMEALAVDEASASNLDCGWGGLCSRTVCMPVPAGAGVCFPS